MSVVKSKYLDGHYLLYDESMIDKPLVSYFEPDYWLHQKAITGKAKGRGTTLFICHRQQDWVLRHYKRGGLPGRLLNDQYYYTGLESTRAWREFKLLDWMQKHQLSTPKPIAAKVVKSGLVYRADIIQQKISNATDLHYILTRHSLNESVWRQIGKAVGNMHLHQVYHHDLNIRNLMLDIEEQPWIIDFDRGKRRSGNSWKKQNLERLQRSIDKEFRRNSVLHWQSSNWKSFIDGYQNT